MVLTVNKRIESADWNPCMAYFCQCQNINKDMSLQCDHNFGEPANVQWIGGTWPQTSSGAAVYHVTWHDMMWHGMACHGFSWNGLTRHGNAWHGMTWHDVMLHVTWCDVTCHDVVWHGIAWCDMTTYMTWICMWK